ncbi:Rossmann-like and DUF2520 domain-containing protein [Anaerotignum sp.]|uniref:Rossmann-like and DUF2520 domain-containing protein n=1 Tax=Anaerotignum sp. TaxID=2039241 RepID=UPI002ED35279
MWRWYDIKIGFIGPGKVGVNLARYFLYHGLTVSGFFGRTLEHTQEACRLTNTNIYTSIEEIVQDNEIIWITTPDDTILAIDHEISKLNVKGKSICHASGSLPSTVLQLSKKAGATVYSIHPIYAFSHKTVDFKELQTVKFSLEGDFSHGDEDAILQMMKKIGNFYFIRSAETAAIYHLANVFVSNLTLSLLDIGVSYFLDMGLSKEEAISVVMPLVKGNIRNIEEKGFLSSLTGPVLRGDWKTLQRHLSVIKKEDEEIYKKLSLHLLELARKKETGEKAENYNKIEFCLKGLEK